MKINLLVQYIAMAFRNILFGMLILKCLLIHLGHKSIELKNRLPLNFFFSQKDVIWTKLTYIFF